MRTKNIEVTNIIRAYAAVGYKNTISLNNWVDTTTANVPFCKPHSNDIHFLCEIPDAKNFAKKYPTKSIITLSVKATRPEEVMKETSLSHSSTQIDINTIKNKIIDVL